MKEFLLRLFYWLGVDSLFYWLNRKAKRTLVFHNVLPDSMSGSILTNGCTMCLSDFKFVVRELGRHFGFSTDVFDPKTITLTFDDGYHNQYSVAYLFLRGEGIPACLFVSGDAISGKVLAIDKISLWFAVAPKEVIPGGDRQRFWNEVLWPRYCQDGANRGGNVVKYLDELYPFDQLWRLLPAEFLKERIGGISKVELDEMRSHGWIVGWHTQTHSPLSTLSEAESRMELSPPEEMKGLPMSYPYGSEDLVGDRECDCAAGLGYPCAFANTHESMRNVSPYFMPRMHIWNFEKYDIHYEMSGLRFFVKHHRLLPVTRRNNAL